MSINNDGIKIFNSDDYITPEINEKVSETPNVVISNPNIRKGINIAVSAIGITLGTVISVDLASNNFDLSDITNPILAGYLYLAGVFGVAVTLPNIPKKV